jgi:hypothetical protein
MISTSASERVVISIVRDNSHGRISPTYLRPVLVDQCCFVSRSTPYTALHLFRYHWPTVSLAAFFLGLLSDLMIALFQGAVRVLPASTEPGAESSELNGSAVLRHQAAAFRFSGHCIYFEYRVSPECGSLLSLLTSYDEVRNEGRYLVSFCMSELSTTCMLHAACCMRVVYYFE